MLRCDTGSKLPRMDTSRPSAATSTVPAHPTLRVVRRGEVVAINNVPPTRTLLELLRDDLGLTGTKEGCRSGDCGACTVVLGEPDGSGGVRHRAINSCIRLAQSVNGMALWTVEDLAMVGRTPCGNGTGQARSAELHPVQQALVNHHASQCGFCTPGFAMSLFALYQTRTAQAQLAGTPPQAVERDEALHALSGNLCRCTGYRPILDAAQSMLDLPLVPPTVDKTIQLLKQTSDIQQAEGAVFSSSSGDGSYMMPTSLLQLLALRARHPGAQLVAGCTDVGIWVTKLQQSPSQVLDVTRCAELGTVTHMRAGLEIGAAATLTDAFDALVADRPALAHFASRFAGLPVRNSGTLGGNVANGSPIGDSMPLLMALGAQVRLMSWTGDGEAPSVRELPLEDFYVGYRKTVLAPAEVLTHILIPAPLASASAGTPTGDGQWLRAYKVSKRFEDDISAVCLALQLQLQGGMVTAVRIGAGGVAATPVRARNTEAALVGQAWTLATVQTAMAVLRAEFTPISDMRASAAYRQQVLGALLQRCWLESQGHTAINLEHISRQQLTGVAA